MLKKALFVILILLLASTAFAFDVSVPSDSVFVRRGDIKEVPIEITNDLTTKNYFTMGITDVKPWTSFDTTQPVVDPNSIKTIKLIINPNTDVSPATFKIIIDITSTTTGERKTKDLIIIVTKGDGAEIKSASITGDLIPTGSIDIALSVNNYGTITLQDLTLNVTIIPPEGDAMEFSENIEKLDPSLTVEIQKNLKLPEAAPAGNYNVVSRLYHQGREISVNQQVFRVAERPMVEELEETFWIFLGYGKTFKARNIGNAVATDVVFTEKMGGISLIFYSGEQPTSKIGDTFEWKITSIMPGEEARVTYYINFLPVIAIIIIAVVLIWYYLVYIRTIKIEKYVMEEKTISIEHEFTVRLDIKNASGRELNDITVKDSVSPIFKVRIPHGFMPEKSKSANSKNLVWKIKHMNKDEERIFTYKVIPGLGVHGQMELSKASAEFKQGRMKKKVYSNAPMMGEPVLEEKKKQKTSWK